MTREQAERGRLNPKMFNAFLDGSKPAIESAAIANACRLQVPEQGLNFPSGSIDDIPQLMRPKAIGGILDRSHMVEVVSSLTTEGEPVAYDIRKGVWVCIEADTDYVRNCFEEYKITTDDTGRYSCLYKRWHMIGLELGMSVGAIAVRGEASGAASCFNADVAAGFIAETLKVKRLLLLTDVEGVLDNNKKLIVELNKKKAFEYIKKGTIKGGMIPKVKTCFKTLNKGVRGVALVDGRKENAILMELLTEKGAGTLIKK